METRASYILVGSFVLGLIAALVGVAVWIAGIEFDKAPAKYLTYFTGNVTGLGIGSAVRYRGVPVGTVRSITLDAENVERVRVLMEVSADTPIKEDTVAELALQGITGVAFIQLSGGTHAAKRLSAPAGNIPVIASQKSVLQEVLGSLPKVLEKAVLVADRIGDLMSKKNLDAITGTLENVENFTASLGAKQGELQLLLRDARSAAQVIRDAGEAFKESAANIQAVTGRMDKRIGPLIDNSERTMNNFRANMADLGKAARTISRIAESAQSIVDDNKGPLRDFSRSGLYEFSQFISEARILVDSLTRLINRIERDPSNFLFGDSQKGVRPQ